MVSACLMDWFVLGTVGRKDLNAIINFIDYVFSYRCLDNNDLFQSEALVHSKQVH